jgi:predicted restriction endonuclease
MAGLVAGWSNQLPRGGRFQDGVLNSLTDLPRGKQRQLAMLAVRQGQSDFRQGLLKAYRSRCAISGCDVEQVLPHPRVPALTAGQ